MKMIGPPRKSGPKPNPRREFYRLKYDLRPEHNGTHRKLLSNCVQLDACKDEEAIRILLGVKVSE